MKEKGAERMLKKATSGVLSRSALLTYRSTLRLSPSLASIVPVDPTSSAVNKQY